MGIVLESRVSDFLELQLMTDMELSPFVERRPNHQRLNYLLSQVSVTLSLGKIILSLANLAASKQQSWLSLVV